MEDRVPSLSLSLQLTETLQLLLAGRARHCACAGAAQPPRWAQAEPGQAGSWCGRAGGRAFAAISWTTRGRSEQPSSSLKPRRDRLGQIRGLGDAFIQGRRLESDFFASPPKGIQGEFNPCCTCTTGAQRNLPPASPRASPVCQRRHLQQPPGTWHDRALLASAPSIRGARAPPAEARSEPRQGEESCRSLVAGDTATTRQGGHAAVEPLATSWCRCSGPLPFSQLLPV